MKLRKYARSGFWWMGFERVDGSVQLFYKMGKIGDCIRG